MSNRLKQSMQHVAGQLEQLGIGSGYAYDRVDRDIKAIPKLKPQQITALEEKYKHSATFLEAVQECGVTPEQLKHMKDGGHYVLKGEAADKFYDKLSKCENMQPRLSSHYNDSKTTSDLGGNVAVFNHVLIGRATDKDGESIAWWQCEKSPFKKDWSWQGIKNNIGHIYDMTKYFLTGKQVGPGGFSEHTDKNPIYVEPKQAHTPTLSPQLSQAARMQMEEASQYAKPMMMQTHEPLAAHPQRSFVDQVQGTNHSANRRFP